MFPKQWCEYGKYKHIKTGISLILKMDSKMDKTDTKHLKTGNN